VHFAYTVVAFEERLGSKLWMSCWHRQRRQCACTL